MIYADYYDPDMNDEVYAWEDFNEKFIKKNSNDIENSKEEMKTNIPKPAPDFPSFSEYSTLKEEVVLTQLKEKNIVDSPTRTPPVRGAKKISIGSPHFYSNSSYYTDIQRKVKSQIISENDSKTAPIPYKRANGAQGEVESISYLFKDCLINEYRHKGEVVMVPIYHEDNVQWTCQESCQEYQKKVKPLFAVKLSKYKTILATTDCFFKEHSGISLGSPKKYKKPVGPSQGIEIELAFNGKNWEQRIANKLQFSSWLAKEYPEWVAERDGSLEEFCHNSSSGTHSAFQDANLELVSPPLTPKTLIEELSVIIKNLIRFNGVVPTSSFYGLHITCNIFGKHIKKSAARLIRCVNAKNLRLFWSKLSRRANSDSLQKYAPFQDVDKIEEESLIGLSGPDNNHYRSVFARNMAGSALEIRIFQSTINMDNLEAIIELVDHLANWSMSLHEDWLEYLSANMSNHLHGYLDFCGVGGMLVLDKEFDEKY